MVKPLGVHAREETVVVAVKVVEVEVVVIQYKRNLPSRSMGWSSSFWVLSKSKSLALGRGLLWLFCKTSEKIMKSAIRKSASIYLLADLRQFHLP